MVVLIGVAIGVYISSYQQQQQQQTNTNQYKSFFPVLLVQGDVEGYEAIALQGLEKVFTRKQIKFIYAEFAPANISIYKKAHLQEDIIITLGIKITCSKRKSTDDLYFLCVSRRGSFYKQRHKLH